jgi:hypothetical protein
MRIEGAVPRRSDLEPGQQTLERFALLRLERAALAAAVQRPPGFRIVGGGR